MWSSLIRSLTRVTSGGRFIPVVDGLRFLAILAVVLYHTEDYVHHKTTDGRLGNTSTVHRILHVGGCGVPIFFALSGFILAVPFVEQLHGPRRGESLSLKRYYLRRLTRLEPPYLINLLVGFLLLIVILKADAGELLPHLLASMAYVHNQVYGTMSAINPVVWSLEIEVQFYLLAPFLATLLLGPTVWVRRGLMLSIIGLMIAVKTAYPSVPPRLGLSLAWTIDHFLTGMLLADVFVTSWKSEPTRAWRWDLLGMAAAVGIVITQRQAQMFHLLPLLTLALFIGAFRGHLLNWVFTRPVIVVIGGMCYTIYLYHFWVISFVGRFTLPLTAGWDYTSTVLIQAALMLPVILLVSIVMFRLIERPFMVWRPWTTSTAKPVLSMATQG